MQPRLPTVGALFDIAKVDSGYYGRDCWEIFWRSIGPSELAGALLFEGDTKRTLKRKESVFCIAVQSVDTTLIDKVSSALSRSESFQKVCMAEPFIDARRCQKEPLASAGRIDEHGRLVGDVHASGEALAKLLTEKLWHSSSLEQTQAVPAPERDQLIALGESAIEACAAYLGQARGAYLILSRIGTEAAVQALYSELKCGKALRTMLACEALGKAKGRAAIGALSLLAKLADLSHKQVAASARKAASRITERLDVIVPVGLKGREVKLRTGPVCALSFVDSSPLGVVAVVERDAYLLDSAGYRMFRRGKISPLP